MAKVATNKVANSATDKYIKVDESGTKKEIAVVALAIVSGNGKTNISGVGYQSEEEAAKGKAGKVYHSFNQLAKTDFDYTVEDFAAKVQAAAIEALGEKGGSFKAV